MSDVHRIVKTMILRQQSPVREDLGAGSPVVVYRLYSFKYGADPLGKAIAEGMNSKHREPFAHDEASVIELVRSGQPFEFEGEAVSIHGGKLVYGGARLPVPFPFDAPDGSGQGLAS